MHVYQAKQILILMKENQKHFMFYLITYNAATKLVFLKNMKKKFAKIVFK